MSNTSGVTIWQTGDNFRVTWDDCQLDFSGVLPEGAEYSVSATGGSVRGIRSYAEVWAMLRQLEPSGHMWVTKN